MKNIAKYIDHTCLKATASEEDIAKLCREAKKYGFASVCVNPCKITLAKKLLAKTRVKVCTVIDFPLGASMFRAKALGGLSAVMEGATELDFVANIDQLKAAAQNELVRENMLNELLLCNVLVKSKKKSAVTKLILECCYLTDGEKVLGCKLAKEAGFDFVKTSTGFGTGGATVHDVKLLRKAVGKKMGVKAAGGIRTLKDAMAMIAAGANRLGCSASVDIVRESAAKAKAKAKSARKAKKESAA